MRRTGRYRFIGQNLLRLLLILIAFGAATWAVTNYLVDLNAVMAYMQSHFPNWLTVTIFFLSESVMGFLPPDLFIVWGLQFPMPYAMVLLLATLSYAGGIVSWVIGRWLYHFPKIQKFVELKFAEQFATFRKYGSLVIIISALTPLPFSPLSIVAGVAKYPLRLYMLMALSRFVRFFIYASVLTKIV